MARKRLYATAAEKQAAYRQRKAELQPTHFHQVYRWRADDPQKGEPGSGVSIAVLPTHDQAIAYRDGYLDALRAVAWEAYDLNMASSPDGTTWVFDVCSIWRHVCTDCDDYVWSYRAAEYTAHSHCASCRNPMPEDGSQCDCMVGKAFDLA